MKCISLWAGRSSHDVNVHDLDKEVFEKLIPAFDKLEYNQPSGNYVGRITIDFETTMSFWHSASKGTVFRDVIKEAVQKALHEDFVNGFPLGPEDLKEKEG